MESKLKGSGGFDSRTIDSPSNQIDCEAYKTNLNNRKASGQKVPPLGPSLAQVLALVAAPSSDQNYKNVD